MIHLLDCCFRWSSVLAARSALVRLGGALSLLLFLTSCAETQLAVHGIKEVVRLSEPEVTPEPNPIPVEETKTDQIRLGTYKVGKPYEINGLWYYPKEDPYYNEVGIASWYGKQFHGKITANGAIYDMNDLTCLLYTSPSPRDLSTSRMPSSA